MSSFDKKENQSDSKEQEVENLQSSLEENLISSNEKMAQSQELELGQTGDSFKLNLDDIKKGLKK